MRHAWLLPVILSLLTGIAAAAEEDLAPAEVLAHLEEVCLGKTPPGNLSQRLADLEGLLLGYAREGTIPERVAFLRAAVFTSTAQRPSICFRLNALEWALYHRVFAGPFLGRLEALENVIQGRTGSGALTERLAALAAFFWPEGRPPIAQMDLTARTLVKIVLLADLSSRENKPGDAFPFAVAETVFQDGMVALPKGRTGQGRIARIDPPGNMGRDARITVVFGPVGALDGTPVEIAAGEECIAANKSQSLTVQVTTAGMIVLGPAGILSGLFVRGKDIFLAKGTELYVQTTAVTPCLTLAVEDR